MTLADRERWLDFLTGAHRECVRIIGTLERRQSLRHTLGRRRELRERSATRRALTEAIEGLTFGMSTARRRPVAELVSMLAPDDLAAALVVVDAVLDETDGQLSTSLRHHLAMFSNDVDLEHAARKRRAEWHRARARPIPRLASGPVCE